MTNIEKLLEQFSDEELMVCDSDDFDAAIIGTAQRCGQPRLVVYSRTKCIEILVADGMTREEAEEHFEFNVVGAWVGELTPLFVEDLE